MPRIATEDAQTFTVQQDDGSVTPPISKVDAPDQYRALKMGGDGSAAALFNAPSIQPAVPPQEPAIDPSVSANTATPQQLSDFAARLKTSPMSAAPTVGEMPPADGPPAPMQQIQPVAPAGPQAGDMVTLGTTNNKTSQTIVPEQDKQAIQAGFDQQTAATDGLDGSYTQAQKERDVARSNQEATLSAEQKQTEETAKKRAAQEKTFNDELQSKINDYNNTEIKAKGVFDDKNLGQQVLAGVAIALGAAGQALSGTKTNYAIDIFNQAIERDLDSQKANLQKKGQAVTFTGIVQDAARKAGMADDEARTKVFQLRYKQIDSQLAGIQDQVQTDEQKAKIAGLRGQLATESAKMQAKLDEKNVERTTQTETRPLKPSEVGGKPEGLEVPPDQHKVVMANYQLEDSLNDLEALRAAQHGDAGALSGRWERMRSKYGFAKSANVAEAVAKAEQMGQQILQKLSGTAASDKQAATIKEFTPQWGEGDDSFAGKVANLRAGLSTERDAFERTYGSQPKNLRWPWQGKESVQQKKDSVGFQ